MKTITVTDNLAAMIERMHNEEAYYQEKAMLCKALSASIFNLVDGEFKRKEDQDIAYFLSLHDYLIDEFAKDKEDNDTEEIVERNKDEIKPAIIEEKTCKIYKMRLLSTL